MLLSLLGIRREDKDRHRAVEFAIAVEELPERSKVFRKLRRGADLENIRPDYQDLLTELLLWVWVRRNADSGDPCLADRLKSGFAERSASIQREGGVSLGESSYLINSVTPSVPNRPLYFVRPDLKRFYSLPVWVDHAIASNTITSRFTVDEVPVALPTEMPWFQIPAAPPVVPPSVKARGKHK